MGSSLEISIADRDAIMGFARNSIDEICGLLLGEAGRVQRVLPCANVAPDPARRFELDPRALITAHRTARDGGPSVIGHYHSHPSGIPTPSPRDAEDAAPDGAIWIVTDGRDLTAWRAARDGAVHGRFDRVELILT